MQQGGQPRFVFWAVSMQPISPISRHKVSFLIVRNVLRNLILIM
jgi:hypothetical protein